MDLGFFSLKSQPRISNLGSQFRLFKKIFFSFLAVLISVFSFFLFAVFACVSMRKRLRAFRILGLLSRDQSVLEQGFVVSTARDSSMVLLWFLCEDG